MATRLRVLVGLLAGATGLAVVLLWEVLTTVFFAITVAYVLYPVQQALSRRGIRGRLAAAISTLLAFLAAVALFAPIGWSLYRRRLVLLSFLESLPPVIEFELFGALVVLEREVVVTTLRSWLADLAVTLASEAPVIALKLFLFVLLVYALLLRPLAAWTVASRILPSRYEDVLLAMHRRARDTLYAIYILQGATAVSTAVVAYAVFAGLGYQPAFSLAVAAGILQFVPVIGPSVLVLGLAAVDVLAGNPTAAVTVTVVGLVLIGFLPDAVLRPQLARYTADMPASLYFIGFTGGVLSIGIFGFIAGPLVVGLFVEAVDLLRSEVGAERVPEA